MQKTIRSFDKTKIVYDVARNKTRWFLVFLHGAGGDYTAWDVERELLHSKGISTIAIDMRGHGLSDRPGHKEAYGLDNFAKDVRRVVQHERARRHILVGHCFGGMVSMNYQKLFPNAARSYILIDTTDKAPTLLEPFNNPFLMNIVNAILESARMRESKYTHADFSSFVGTQDIDARRLISDVSHMTFRSWLFVYENMSQFDGRRALKTIQRPVLIIHGTRDTFFGTQLAKEMKHRVPHAMLDLVTDANHVIVINNPGEIVYAIWSFLNKTKHQIGISLQARNRRLTGWLRFIRQFRSQVVERA